VIIKGRYTGAGRGTIRLKGRMAGSDFVREIPVEFPETMASHDVLAPLWARARVDNLMGQDYRCAQYGQMSKELKDTITQLGIEYRLMTQFTSFVAVEEMIVTDGGVPRRIDVPIESPEGMKVMRDEESVNGFINQGFIGRRNARAKAGTLSGSISGAMARGAGAAPPPPNSPPVVSSVTATVGTPTATPEADQVMRVLSPDEQQLEQKLHRSLRVVVEKLKRKEALSSADGPGFIRNGKAEVQIWLTEKSPLVMTKLRELGFEVILDAKNSKLIIGRLPIEKLEPLVRLNFVKYVSPQTTK